MPASEHIKIAEKLFTERSALMEMWQVIAENFYGERADFTTERSMGDADNDLFGSYPVLARRELGNVFSSNLRPRALKWFSQHAAIDELDKQRAVREYLEHRSRIQWDTMYDPKSQFVGETRAADHDFATFGNAVIEVAPNFNRDGLLFRNRHLRDCVWLENADGAVDTLYFKWNPTASQLVQKYGDKVSKDTRDKARKTPGETVPCYIMSVPERSYKPDSNPGRRALSWTMLVVEKEDERTLEETPEDWFRFIVPRWHKVGSQYATSPAVSIAFPDGRTFQVVVRTLREAGEMHVNPPMISIVDALRSDAELYPGGQIIADSDVVGERDLDQIMRPVYGNPGAMPIGFEIAAALKEDIKSGFFLDKLKLPDVSTKQMTAYEFSKRLEEHIRESSPMFEPIEDEYNAPLVELVHTIMEANKWFGPASDIPDEISGARTEFKFRSPLKDVQDQAKAGLFTDWMERIVLPSVNYDPALTAQYDIQTAGREASEGLSVPATWLGKEEAVEQARVALAKQKEMAAGIQALQAGGDAAQSVGQGAASIDAAMGGESA